MKEWIIGYHTITGSILVFKTEEKARIDSHSWRVIVADTAREAKEIFMEHYIENNTY